MRPHPHHYAPDIFASSPCPDPGALTFIAFTIMSIAWAFNQLCPLFVSSSASSLSRSKKLESHTQISSKPKRKMTVSLLYAMMCGILLLDSCWIATIYTWSIRGLSAGASRGIMDFVFTVPVLAILIMFLLIVFALWGWAVWVTMRQLFELWTDQEGALEDPLAGTCRNIDSK
ncbi:hypothetical protein F4801DRAFT_571127 [Xylaria longipes]|nr:hypothetical protein F4801DRAFT_571127 [Xylaria longipes]